MHTMNQSNLLVPSNHSHTGRHYADNGQRLENIADNKDKTRNPSTLHSFAQCFTAAVVSVQSKTDTLIQQYALTCLLTQVSDELIQQ